MWSKIKRGFRRQSSRRYRVALLAGVDYFDDLSSEAIAAIADEMEEVRLPIGAVLCREHDLPGLLILRSGKAKVFSMDSGDGRLLLVEIASGQHLGALSHVGIPATALVETVAPTTILKLNQAGFEKVARDHPDIRSKLEAIRDNDDLRSSAQGNKRGRP